MPIVDITILGAVYRVSCGDGEEQRLKLLALRLNERLETLAITSPTASDSKIFVINSLMMEDRIQELESKQNYINSVKTQKSEIESEDLVAKALEAVTEYVESLANKLEKL